MKKCNVESKRVELDELKVFYSTTGGELIEVKNGMLFVIDDDAVKKHANNEPIGINCFPVNDEVPQILIADTIKCSIDSICKNAVVVDMKRCEKMLKELMSKIEDDVEETDDERSED